MTHKRGMKMEKISLTADDNSIVDFYILDQQKLFGINYLLVADSEEGDGEALILKDTAGPLDPESVYSGAAFWKAGWDLRWCLGHGWMPKHAGRF